LVIGFPSFINKHYFFTFTEIKGQYVTDRLGYAMINLPNKFEVHVFTRYRNMKGVAKCRKWGGLGG